MLNQAQDDDLVMNLVELALTRPADQREAYLRSACGNDTELYEQVLNYVQWEQRMDGFLLDPLYPAASYEHPFEPDDLLDGRFRIVREVAQGGMGVVYEAVDEKLQRRIALKCAKTGFRKRLPPEVLNATEISHPNVCKIFEIHTASTRQGEIDFITMEFLDGETLADRIASGPLPEKEARSIAFQLCAGLAEAHRNQVIHGDLKSNNVILATGPHGVVRAVITDFGLARRPEMAQSTTPSGPMAGTPDYMAPELWKGAKASVASDIYALGVILYELACGRRPFESSPDLMSKVRLTCKTPAGSKWDKALLRCLDPEPERRFSSVSQVAQAIAPYSRRWMLAAALAAALAIVSAVVTYRSTIAPPEIVRLAFLPLQTEVSDRSLGEGLLHQTAEQLLHVRNTRARRLTLIPLDAALQNKLDRPEKAVRFLNASHVVYGTLRRDGGRALLHIYVTDAHSQIPLNEWQAGYPLNELQVVPVALAGMITSTLRLLPLAITASVNAAAFPDFTRGIGLLERNAADDAIPFFENAVRADPGSPLTHARLAEAQLVKYSFTHDVTWLERAISSLGDARQRNPEVAQVWLVSGIINQNRGLYEAAQADLHRALEIEPENGDVWRRLGWVYEDDNRISDAFRAYEKAIQLQPTYFRGYQDLCALLSNQAKHEEAIRQCTNMVALAPDLSGSYYFRGLAYFNWGRYSEAELDLRTALNLDEASSRAIQLLAGTLLYEGRYQDAISLFQRARQIGPETSLLFLNLGQALRWAGQPRDAIQAYQNGAALAQAELAQNSRDGIVQARLAYMLARLGQRNRAESEAVLAMQPSQASPEVARWVVMTYEALGEDDRALAVAEMAPDDALRRLSRSPDLADLQKNVRFQQLMKSRRIKGE